jgi:hypothetical protein
MKVRTATVTHIFPQEGRRRGYISVIDEENSLHYFYDPEWIPRFPDLKKGDRIRIEYTSTPSRGGWYITETL